MKKLFIILFLMLSSGMLSAQNVGINNTGPLDYTLHVRDNATEAGVGVNATGTANHAIVNLSIDDRINGNSLFLIKYRSGVSGTIGGINKSNLAVLGADAGAGELLITTNQNSNMYFSTNNTQRMMIAGGGHIGINTTNPQFGWLHAVSNDIYSAIYAENNSAGAVAVEGFGTAVNGIGVSGAGSNTPSPYAINSYGVLGRSGSTGVGIGGFSTGTATAVWAQANQSTALAIYSYGKVQFQNIGETGGYVLTSDAVGNATWQYPSTGVWTFNTGNIYNNNVGTVAVGTTSPTPYAKLHVLRQDNIFFGALAERGAIYGENASGNNGSGVYGVSAAPKGTYYYAGVTGTNASIASDAYGVVGQSSGITSGTIYSAGVGGFGDYGVLGSSASSTGAGVMAQNSNGKTALQIDNGFIKVSGTNKTAFKHTTAAGNTAGDYTLLTYDSPSINDIVIVTHNYTPNNTYLNKSIGVFWSGSTWAIYNEDLSIMTVNISFNVLVIKQ
ncbi:MAG: hypothetical protein ABJA78_12455 [Ferruginibacter sp.]